LKFSRGEAIGGSQASQFIAVTFARMPFYLSSIAYS
jgi:hypothetical protein